MAHLTQMLSSHPGEGAVDQETLATAIETIFACAQTCEACADACLGESDVQSLRRCIRTDLDCADICRTTGKVLTRQTEVDWAVVQAQLRACIAACEVCRAECQRHADHHEHCRICADMCARCEEVCSRLLATLPIAA